MAGRRDYGGSEMTVLVQNDGFSAETFEALLSLSSSNGSRSMLNIEDVCGSRVNQQPFNLPREMEEVAGDDLEEGLHHPEKKRRLSASQVQFLEKSFEAENKLEPQRKVQLAKDLGLHPRQVAIWFQNRRARWKTKQLAKDYETLESSYNVLKADYGNLLKEKDELNAEVVHLTEKLLLKEKHIGITEVLELTKPDCNSLIDLKRSESQLSEVRQEDHSSTNSAVSSSESPHFTDGARTVSSNASELDQSDISHIEKEEEVKGHHQCLELGDNSCSFDFPVEDHSFWLWP